MEQVKFGVAGATRRGGDLGGHLMPDTRLWSARAVAVERR